MNEQSGVVVILDVLGVKGLLARQAPDDFLASWQETIRHFRRETQRARTVLGSLCTDHSVTAFSDTLIITMAGTNYSMLLLAVGRMLAGPFCVALQHRLFLRGVISVGTYHRDRSTVIGQAIDEAAEWYEEPNWMGVSASPSAAFLLTKIRRQRGKDSLRWFAEYKVPYNSSVTLYDSWAISWPTLWIRKHGENATSELLDLLATAPIGIKVLPKYEQTLRFFDTFAPVKDREAE